MQREDQWKTRWWLTNILPRPIYRLIFGIFQMSALADKFVQDISISIGCQKTISVNH